MNGHQLPPLQRVISIRTPENIELNYALAGAGSRAAAYVVDFLLMLFVGQLLVNLLISLLTVLLAALPQGGAYAAAVGGVVLFLGYNGYFIFCEWLLSGQTPGKRLLHIRVLKQGGYALRFVDTLVRNLLRWIDFIPVFYGVGLVSLLLTRNSQRLGDLAAGTLVVHQEPLETGSLLVDLPATSGVDTPLPAAQLALLPAGAVALAAEFLRRRPDLAPRSRQEVAAELVDVIRRACGLTPQATQSAETFLAVIIRQAEQIGSSSYPVQATSGQTPTLS